MKEAEFRNWMADEGQSLATQNTQAADAKRIENHYGDLDHAFDTDGLEAIRQTLTYSKEDERAGRPNPAKFNIDGDLYANLSHYRSTLNFYSRFRTMTDTTAQSEEDIDKRIELYDDAGNAHWPVRQLDRTSGDVSFRIRGASNRTIDAEKTTDILKIGRALFKEGRSVRVVRSNNGRRPYLSYGKQKLTSYKLAPEIAAALSMPEEGNVSAETSQFDPLELEKLKQRFLFAFPDFEPSGFARNEGGYFNEERSYKDALLEKAKEALDDKSLSEAELGGRFLDILTSPKSGLLGWRTDTRIKDLRESHPGILEAEAGLLILSENDPPDALNDFVQATWPILSEGQKSQPYSESRNIPSMLLALAHPTEAMGINTDPLWRVGKALTGKSPFGNNPLNEYEYAAVLDLAETLFEKFEEWGWQPRDFWDVQGFIWVVRETPDAAQPDNNSDHDETKPMPRPTNLILYGPPGTGKTYRTAKEAVELCDGSAPDDRSELKARYDTLVEAGQIGFVTFHQSYAYEDFVEGLRPETGSGEGDDEGAAAGFRLEPKRGIFREISALAQQSRRSAGRPTGLDLSGREFFKMSLGRAGSEDHGLPHQGGPPDKLEFRRTWSSWWTDRSAA